MITADEKSKLVVGFKQVCKAVKSDNCSKIFLAEDCSGSISDRLRAASGNVPVVSVPTMRELGTMCGIDVSASCAALLRL